MVFLVAEKVDRIVKILFHVFGVVDALYGMIYLYYNYRIYVCVSHAHLDEWGVD